MNVTPREFATRTALASLPPQPAPVHRLLDRLLFRQGLGTCYLAYGGRGRRVLVVPELRLNGPLARLDAYSGATIEQAHRLKLIVLAQEARLINYAYSHAGDRKTAKAVALTDLGRSLVTPDRSTS